jgi:hypothetical protein
MAVLLSLDVGLSTGVALLCDDAALTDTVKADDLASYLHQLRAAFTLPRLLHPVLAERPLTIFRSQLSRDLATACHTVSTAFPEVQWVEPAAWKQQGRLLVRHAHRLCPDAWRATRSIHERDALLLALWARDAIRT